MFLFKKADAKKTEQNVLDFFDEDYKKLLMMAGSNLQSPVLSAAPASNNNSNTQEGRFVKLVSSRKILEAVNRSIKACSVTSQTILNKRVINGDELFNVMVQLNISSYSTYYKMQTVACNEFADAFEVQAEPYFNQGENDLHSYQK